MIESSVHPAGNTRPYGQTEVCRSGALEGSIPDGLL